MTVTTQHAFRPSAIWDYDRDYDQDFGTLFGVLACVARRKIMDLQVYP